MNSDPVTPGRPATPIISALLRILRPLVRLLLSQGITYPVFCNLLKSVYVDVASKEFSLDGKRQTDSRLSLLTGVHRKDIKRLCQAEQSGQPPPSAVTLGGQLVAHWVSDATYLDSRKQPRALARLTRDGGERSFEALVSSVSKDIRSRAVLDEWLRLGVAHIDEKDRVCLNVEAFIPENGLPEKAHYFGHNLHDHMAAGVHNLLNEQPSLLERSVYYDQLTPASVQELASLSRQLGNHALKTINLRAMKLEHADAGALDATERMNFGIYFYTARTDAAVSDCPLNDAESGDHDQALPTKI